MEGGIPMILSETQFYVLIFLVVAAFLVTPAVYLFKRGSSPPADGDVVLAPEQGTLAPSVPLLTRVRGMSEDEFRRAHPDCVSISPRWKR